MATNLQMVTLGLTLMCLFGLSQMSTGTPSSQMLFDFRELTSLSSWTESSDTVRTPGMSKASLVLQKTKLFQRAILFTLLNPQPNGAGFAGMRTDVDLDLKSFDAFRIRARTNGPNRVYKIILRHRNEHNDGAYEHQFEMEDSSEFMDKTLMFDEFDYYYRGQLVPDAPPLDTSRLTQIGLQMFGGVYEPFKQAGVDALEIDFIEAIRKEE